MTKIYNKWKCPYCRKLTSSNGLARTSHLRAHVRKGLLEEVSKCPSVFEKRVNILIKDHWDASNSKKSTLHIWAIRQSWNSSHRITVRNKLLKNGKYYQTDLLNSYWIVLDDNKPIS